MRPAAEEETACNLCGRRDFVPVAMIDRDARPLRTVVCRGCGLVWTNPRPSAADVDRYYATSYRADYTRVRAPTRRKILRGMLGARDRIRTLRAVLPEGTHALDVGCGAGEFLFLLRRGGIAARGIEPGEDYAAFARTTLGVPVETATVDTAVVEPASQDVVTMFHALEHVADPRHTLTTVRGWLKQGGALVVEVPNVESTVQSPRHRFHFAHFFNFNAATLGALGEAVGLRLIQSHLSDDGGNVTCVFRHLSDARREAVALPENAARVQQVLQTHTTMRHYGSLVPYRRAAGRLARRWREDRLLRRLPTTDAIVAWASGPEFARE